MPTPLRQWQLPTAGGGGVSVRPAGMYQYVSRSCGKTDRSNLRLDRFVRAHSFGSVQPGRCGGGEGAGVCVRDCSQRGGTGTRKLDQNLMWAAVAI